MRLVARRACAHVRAHVTCAARAGSKCETQGVYVLNLGWGRGTGSRSATVPASDGTYACAHGVHDAFSSARFFRSAVLSCLSSTRAQGGSMTHPVHVAACCCCVSQRPAARLPVLLQPPCLLGFAAAVRPSSVSQTVHAPVARKRLNRDRRRRCGQFQGGTCI